MSKRLKLESLKNPRLLRSRMRSTEKVDDLTSETSKFFVDTNKQERDRNTEFLQSGLKNEVTIKKTKTQQIEKCFPVVDIKRGDKDNNRNNSSTNEKSQSKKRSPIIIKFQDSENGGHVISSDMNEEWAPENWETILRNIKEMRKDRNAPVDEMGCHKCADSNSGNLIFRYQSLVALMLSSQTKDTVTHAAMQRLKNYGCTPDSIAAAPIEELGKVIYPVSFWRRKAEYLKETATILKEKYKGDIPDSVEKLCELPGVGPKMAHLCMQIAWDQISGIGVDTHVHRISNRLGWVRKPTKNPEDTRKALETWLPREKWAKVNYLLVGFGQTVCLPRRPKCADCLNKNICPSASKISKK